MYQALYRKWRPRTFDEVVGQEHITETLKSQMVSGRLSHAYLFVGTRGTGKTTCAKILSRAVNCEHPVNGNPCNSCPSCLGIESGSILDVVELDAASNNSVDNIRALRDEAVFTPAAVKKRIYIIDEVHMLSNSAFNALLKILEEPPEHLIFILATTELNKVPATILSRCQRYSFKRLTPDLISGRLQYVAAQEHLQLTEGAARLLGRLAEGGMRDGLSLLDQCSGVKTIDEERVLSAVGLTASEDTRQLLSAVLEENSGLAMKVLDRLYFDGKDPGGVLEEMLRLCRDILLCRMVQEEGEGLLSGAYDPAMLRELSQKAASSVFMYYISTLQSAISELPRAFDRKIAAELCLLRMVNVSEGDGTAALRVRLDRLEQKIRNGSINASPASVSQVPSPAPAPEEAEREEQPALTAEVPEAEERAPEAESVKPMPRPTDSDSVWAEILAEVQPKVNVTVFTFLKEKIHSVGWIENGFLMVGVRNPIARNMIDTTAVKGALKEAAETVTGTPVGVKVTEHKEEVHPDMSKLDALKKFSNFKFQ